MSTLAFVMNKKSVECRACLKKVDEEVSQKLFRAWCTSWAVPGALIADDLAKIADIEISENDRHSKIICSECYNRLADVCLFVITVQKSDSILQKRALNASTSNVTEPESSWPKPILLNKSINGNIDNGIEIEIKQEVLSEEEYGTNEMDIDWEPTMDIKIEPEEIVAPVQSEIQLNGYSLNDAKSNEEAKHQNNSSINYDEEYLDNPVKKEPLSGDEQETIPDLPLDCMLCLKAFNSVTGLKAHVIAQHSYCTVKRKTNDKPSPVKKEINNEFICATCRQRFETRTDLMVHETCHGKHACFVCDAKFNTFRQLSRHSTRCRPRNAGPSRARPPSIPPKDLSQARSTSTEEQIGEPVQKQPRNKLLPDETKTEPILRQIRVKSLTEIKDEPMEIQSYRGVTEEEAKGKPVRKQSLHEPPNEKINVEPVKKQEMNISVKKSIKEPTKEKTLAKTVNRQSDDEPLNDKVKPETVQKESVNKLSEDETNIEKFVELFDRKTDNKPINHDTKDVQIEKQSINEPLNEDIKDTAVEDQSNDKHTNRDTQVEQVHRQNELLNEITVEISVDTNISHQNETNVEDHLMAPAVEAKTCSSLQNLNINQDESSQSGVEMTKSIEENSSQSLLSNSVASLQSQDDSDEILVNVTCPDSTASMEPNLLATEETENKSILEQKLELDNSSNNNGDSTAIKEEISNNDTVKEMKIHLAINPLSKQDSVHIDTKIDEENIDRVRSESCEQKLVNVLSEFSDDKITQ